MTIAWRNSAPTKIEVSTIPLPIVSAIAFVMNTIPTKFPSAAIATARTGVRTFVATIVAIAFAASWNPLKKSKEKTMMMASTRISRTTFATSRDRPQCRVWRHKPHSRRAGGAMRHITGSSPRCR